MPVTSADVLHVATLAKLRLSPDEVVRLTAELNDILGHVAELAEAEDAETDEGPAGPAGMAGAATPAGAAALPGALALAAGAADWPAPLRADDSTPDPLARPPEAIAPEWEGGFFILPRLGAMEGA